MTPSLTAQLVEVALRLTTDNPFGRAHAEAMVIHAKQRDEAVAKLELDAELANMRGELDATRTALAESGRTIEKLTDALVKLLAEPEPQLADVCRYCVAGVPFDVHDPKRAGYHALDFDHQADGGWPNKWAACLTPKPRDGGEGGGLPAAAGTGDGKPEVAPSASSSTTDPSAAPPAFRSGIDRCRCPGEPHRLLERCDG